MQRAERLLAITLLLQARGKMPAHQLAELLGVSIRTIYRDINALSMAHVPVAMQQGPGGGYYLLQEHYVETSRFTREEVVSLVLGGAMVGNYSLFADDEDLHRAFLKLEATLPEEYRDDVRAARERILFDTHAWPQKPATAYLDLIRSALWKGQQLDILYPRTDGSALTWRRVEPYGLVYRGLPRPQVRTGIWYLIALCHCCHQIHPFRVGYIQDVCVRDEMVQKRDDFDLQTYWREARKYLDRRMQSLTMTLKIEAVARHRLRDGATIVREERDGSIIASVPVESLDAAVSYVLSLGPHALVIAPKQVREEVAQAVKHMAILYEQESKA
jgi:predicted DNA-binding transcriptional regulator YafY